jgi:predicted HAD superfamily phosphohydrolase
MKDVFFTDWEGPWVVTDFAYEVTIAFLNNQRFFERLSQYDDYLSYIEKRENYEAGDTLKLLAPFLIAAKVTSEELKRLSHDIVNFIPEAKIALKLLSCKPVVISTAYKQFLEVTANMLGIKDIYGTEFRIEDYEVDEEDKEMVLKAVDIIASLPEIDVKPGMTEDELNEQSKKSINWLNDFFWERLTQTSFGKVIEEIKAMGGMRKKEMVERYMDRYDYEEGIAIGDSISDHAMLEWIRKRGIAVSFNGNEFAIKHANVAVISDTAFGEAAVVDAFTRNGIEGVIDLARYGRLDVVNPEIAKHLSKAKFYWLEDVDLQLVIEESKRMRRILRGKAGKLG